LGRFSGFSRVLVSTGLVSIGAAFFGSGEIAFLGSGEGAFLGSGEGAFLGRGETAGRAGFCDGEGPILTRFSACASSVARLLFNDFGDCGRGGRGCLIGGLMV
jgi:hypothetical protein